MVRSRALGLGLVTGADAKPTGTFSLPQVDGLCVLLTYTVYKLVTYPTFRYLCHSDLLFHPSYNRYLAYCYPLATVGDG